MNILSNEPAAPENEMDQQPSSQRVTMVSILLMICAFLLTSLMLFYYASERKGEDGSPILNLAALKEKAKATYSSLPKIKATTASGEDTENETGKPQFSLNSTGHVKWPKLTLTGFGKSSDGAGGFAIINGKQIQLNQYIDDVRLIRIQANGVVVECKGEQKSLAVNLKE